jgi:hypothetical protein
MPLKNAPLFRIGTLALALCAVLSAQPGTISKWGQKWVTPHNHRAAVCKNCVQALNGTISRNPVPVRAFRTKHPCPATGAVKGGCAGYVISYIKPLNRGGSDTTGNMRWRTIAQALQERSK